MKTETIFYNGFKFTRYPEAKRRSERVYFSGWVNGKKKRLHRYKYEIEVGIIEKGNHIHHLDENPLNNEILNLQSKPGKQHISDHYKVLSEDSKTKITETFISSTKEAASQWHKSDIGKKWHKENALNTNFGKFDFGKGNCEECKKEYDVKTKKSKFCSDKCRSKNRNKSGIDDILKECDYCDRVFEINKYSKVTTCSRSCGQQKRINK